MKLLLFGGVVILVFVGRLIFRMIDKSRQGGAIEQIKKNPALAEVYAEGLDIPIASRPFDPVLFENLQSKLLNSAAIGQYVVRYATQAGPQSVLLFTALSFNDISLNRRGGTGEIQDKAFHDFRVYFDSNKSEIRLNSTLFNNSTEKFQKEEFLKSILTMQA